MLKMKLNLPLFADYMSMQYKIHTHVNIRDNYRIIRTFLWWSDINEISKIQNIPIT